MHKKILEEYPVTKKNREKVVELVRAITEALVYSEQHSESLFQ